MSEFDEDEEDRGILVHVGFDPFMRNIQLNVSSSATMSPADFIAELEEFLDEHGENPELLFDGYGMMEQQ